MHLGFSKLLGKLVVKYVSTYSKGTLKQRSVKDLSNDADAMFFYIKAYVVGTHLNCIDKLMQFKWVSTTFLYKSICHGYSFELHRQANAIEMGTHKYAFIKK